MHPYNSPSRPSHNLEETVLLKSESQVAIQAQVAIHAPPHLEAASELYAFSSRTGRKGFDGAVVSDAPTKSLR